MILSLYQGFVALTAPFFVSKFCLVLMPDFLFVETYTSVSRIKVVPVAPTVVFVRVASHSAWSNNTWDSSGFFFMFDPGHFKTESCEFIVDGRALTMRCGKFQVQPCTGGG